MDATVTQFIWQAASLTGAGSVVAEFGQDIGRKIMAHLTRDQILAAEDITTEEVDVPEWGGSVLVRSLTGQQRDQFEATLVERRGKRTAMNTANIRAKLVSLCVVDEAGQPVFTHADVEALGQKSAAGLARIYDVASKLSGISDDDVEDLAANFTETKGNGSDSSSPSPSPSTTQSPTSSGQSTPES